MGYHYSTLAVLLFLSFSSAVFGSACTDSCNGNYTTGDTVTFCSTAGETFTTKLSAIYPIGGFYSSCYATCGVAVLHVSACGCPNDCYNSTNHGQCTTSSQGVKKCQCMAGWGGNDCSTVKCPNSCSGHGSCTTQTASKGGDYCTCAAGYTSHDCSVKIPQYFVDRPYGSLPFGEISAGGNYYKKDDFNDSHPFFNYSTVATLKFTISDANIKYLYDPSTLYEQDYVDAKLYFNNGILSKSSDCTFRVKGFSSRLMVKKSWNVKFPKDNDYKKLKGFSLKANAGDRQVTSQVIWDTYRSQKVQTYRHAHAQVYINDIFQGLYSLEERIDDSWMKSRFNVDEKKEANLWKFSPYSLQYLGDTVGDYQNYTVTIFDNKPKNGIEQEEGNGDWNDLLDLVLAMNSSESISSEYLQKNFDIEGLLRAWTLETAFQNADASLGSGNNWQLVDSQEGANITWNFIGFDFDTAIVNIAAQLARFLGMTLEEFNAIVDSGVTEIYGIKLGDIIQARNPYSAINRPNKPLAKAVYAYPGSNDTFTAQYKNFVQTVIINNPGRTEQIRQAHYDLIRPIIATDRLYFISATASGSSLATFDQAAQASKLWLQERYSYLSSLFYVNNNGQCDDMGNCTCFENYSGTHCDVYTPPPTSSPTSSPTPSPCSVSLELVSVSSWISGDGNSNQQFQVKFSNVGSQVVSSVTAQITTSGQSTISQSWNLNPSGNGYSFPDYYRWNAYQIGGNMQDAGFILTGPAPLSASISVASITCQ